MKSRNYVLALCAATGLLAGCATGPRFANYAGTVPAAAEGQGRVWFYRPSKMFGAAVQPAVMVNQEKVGKAQPGCFFYADRPPGTYEIKCTTEWADKCQVALAAKETRYVRLGMMIGLFVDHVIPKEVDEPTAVRELQSCKLITADGANRDLKEK